jgi:hypothetical protein
MQQIDVGTEADVQLHHRRPLHRGDHRNNHRRERGHRVREDLRRQARYLQPPAIRPIGRTSAELGPLSCRSMLCHKC